MQISLDTPLRRVFDYRAPAELLDTPSSGTLRPGVRVRVPFGRRRLIGILIGTAAESAVDSAKLKTALEILDEQPIFDPVTLGLLRWAAEYYQHPLGEVFAAALPVSLREGQPARLRTESWAPTDAGLQELSTPTNRRAPRLRLQRPPSLLGERRTALARRRRRGRARR